MLACLGLSSPNLVFAQANPSDVVNEMDEDLNIGGDIFSDFNEDIESAQMMEDERFYRYSRFYSLNIGLGVTTFDGNRGKAYDNDPPTYHISLTYFNDFLNAFVMGVEYSRHSMVLDTDTTAYDDGDASKSSGVGLVNISLLRPFFGYRHYLDTADLGTAITYSNPYFVGRLEYWYVNYKFPENKEQPPKNMSGMGFGVGGGLEFPIELKSTYINVEYLFHSIAFKDKYVVDYQPLYDDLTGYGHSVVVNYTLSW